MLLKKYYDFGGGNKKYSDSEFLSYNLMLDSGGKKCALRDKKNKYSNSRDVRKKNSEPKKTHRPPPPPPPLQVKWSVPY